MKIRLFHRHHGIHTPIKERKLRVRLSKYAKISKKPNVDPDIDEEGIVLLLPENFLPESPSKILLTVETEYGSTGVRSPKLFRHWGKYFDCYCLEIGK